MKLAITARDESSGGGLDPHFGRARKFILFDTETSCFTAHDNAQSLNAAQGAGIQAAQTIVRLGAKVLITGNIGPKAFRALSAAGVKVFTVSGHTVTEAIKDFQERKLTEATTANVEGHWV